MLVESFWLRQAYIHFDGRVPLYFIDPWFLMVGETSEVASLPGSHFTDPKLYFFSIFHSELNLGMHPSSLFCHFSWYIWIACLRRWYMLPWLTVYLIRVDFSHLWDHTSRHDLSISNCLRLVDAHLAKHGTMLDEQNWRAGSQRAIALVEVWQTWSHFQSFSQKGGMDCSHCCYNTIVPIQRIIARGCALENLTCNLKRWWAALVLWHVSSFGSNLILFFWICHVVCKGYNVYPCYICQTVDGTLFAVPVIYFYNWYLIVDRRSS